MLVYVNIELMTSKTRTTTFVHRVNINKELITIKKTTEKRKSESIQTLKLKEQTNKIGNCIIPSKGFTSPELFQSNWAAGISGVFVDDAETDIGCNIESDFIGSSGLKPKLAANRGIELFHFPLYN